MWRFADAAPVRSQQNSQRDKRVIPPGRDHRAGWLYQGIKRGDVKVSSSTAPSATAAHESTIEYTESFNQYPKTSTSGKAVSMSRGRRPTIRELTEISTT